MGLMGYLAAGAVGGASQAVGEGLKTVMAGEVQRNLQKERIEFETLRDQRNQDFQRGENAATRTSNEDIHAASEAGAKDRQKTGFEHDEEMKRGEYAYKAAEDEIKTIRDGQLDDIREQRDIRKEGRQAKQAKALRAEIQQEEADSTKSKGKDKDYLKALHVLANAKESDFDRAQTELAQYKAKMKEDDRKQAIEKADAVTAAAIMRDATLDIDRLSAQVTKAQVDGDTVTVDRLTRQIADSQVMQKAARARAATLAGITVPTINDPDRQAKGGSPPPTGKPGLTDEQLAKQAVTEGNALSGEMVAQEEQGMTAFRSGYQKASAPSRNEQTNQAVSAFLQDLASETKRKLTSRRITPTPKNILEDPEFVQGYIKKFGTVPTEKDVAPLVKTGMMRGR